MDNLLSKDDVFEYIINYLDKYNITTDTVDLYSNIGQLYEYIVWTRDNINNYNNDINNIFYALILAIKNNDLKSFITYVFHNKQIYTYKFTISPTCKIFSDTIFLF